MDQDMNGLYKKQVNNVPVIQMGGKKTPCSTAKLITMTQQDYSSSTNKTQESWLCLLHPLACLDSATSLSFLQKPLVICKQSGIGKSADFPEEGRLVRRHALQRKEGTWKWIITLRQTSCPTAGSEPQLPKFQVLI